MERNPSYGGLLKNELELLNKQPDSYIFHEHLEEVKRSDLLPPIRRARRGRWAAILGGIRSNDHAGKRFPENVGVTLKNIAPDIIRMEQFMDFLRNRMFRQTLLVHADLKLSRDLGPSSLYEMHLASSAQPEGEYEDSLWNDEALNFKLSNGVTLTTSNAITKASLAALSQRWPESIPFQQLATHTLESCPPDSPVAKLEGDDATRVLGMDMLQCYSRGVIECHSVPDAFQNAVAERPLASALARHQATLQAKITNLRHETLTIDEFNRHLLALLDGERNAEQLVAVLSEYAAQGKINIQMNQLQVTEPGQIRAHLTTAVSEMLPRLAKAGVLCA